MSDLTKICSERGLAVDPKAPIDKKAFDLLVDLENLYMALSVTTKGSKVVMKLMNQGDPKNNVQPLTDEGKQIVYGIFGQYKNKSASEIFKMAIDKRKNEGAAETRMNDIEVLAAIVAAARKIEDEAGKYSTGLSAYAKQMHRALSSNVSVTKGIELTIEFLKRKVPASLKKRVNSASNAADIAGIIFGICRAHPEKIIKPVKPVKPAAPAPWHRNLDYSIRLGSGFAHMLKRPENLDILAAEPRGVLARGGISASYKIKPNYTLQIDYNSAVPFGVIGEDKNDMVVSNYDFARFSAVMRPLKNLDILAQAGWVNYRNDYPGERLSDTNAFFQKLRLNYRPIQNLSVNIDEELQAGWFNRSFPADKEFGVRALLNAGVSYSIKLKALTLTPFIGGTVGYLTDREILAYGGYAGLALVSGSHEANILGQYNNVDGVTATARYFYNTARWGIGAEAFYNMYNSSLLDTELKQQTVGVELTGRVNLVKVNLLGERHFGLRPFVRFAHEIESGANVVLGGVEFTLGGLRPAQPSNLRPYSVEALPEVK